MEDQKIMEKDVLRAKAEELTLAFNNAVQSGNFAESSRLNDEIAKAVESYTEIVRGECFKELRESENPMLEAVKRLTFTSIRAKDDKVGEERIPVRKIEECEKPIDLAKLHKSTVGGIGNDKKWIYVVEKLNFLLTAQAAVDLGIDPKLIYSNYSMDQISKDIDMGKTPTSKTNLLKTLQMAVTAMIGEEFKATSHDVAYLLRIFTKKGRQALTVVCANHRYMRQYVMEICHGIVEKKGYNLEYPKKK